MQIEVGNVVSGKVVGIKPFGAFVDLGNGKRGLVHISEVSSEYVKEVKDYLEEGQSVNVKIIKMSSGGKIELSIKQADPKVKEEEKKCEEIRKKISDARFEDMMNKFKKLSDDKLLDFNKKAQPRKERTRREM